VSCTGDVRLRRPSTAPVLDHAVERIECRVGVIQEKGQRVTGRDEHLGIIPGFGDCPSLDCNSGQGPCQQVAFRDDRALHA